MARVELLEVFALPDSTMFQEEISTIIGTLDYFLEDKDVKGTVILTGRKDGDESKTIFRIHIDQSAIVNCDENTDDLAEQMLEASVTQKTITPLFRSRLVERKRFRNTKCLILPTTYGEFYCSVSLDHKELIDEVLRIIGRSLVNLSPGDEDLRDNYEYIFDQQIEENWETEMEVDEVFRRNIETTPIEEIAAWKRWYEPLELFFGEG